MVPLVMLCVAGFALAASGLTSTTRLDAGGGQLAIPEVATSGFHCPRAHSHGLFGRCGGAAAAAMGEHLARACSSGERVVGE